MVPDHFLDDEVQEFLREIGVEMRVFGQLAQPGDLLLLARRIGRRQAVSAFSTPTALVQRKRSASIWISAASMLSIEAR